MNVAYDLKTGSKSIRLTVQVLRIKTKSWTVKDSAALDTAKTNEALSKGYISMSMRDVDCCLHEKCRSEQEKYYLQL